MKLLATIEGETQSDQRLGHQRGLGGRGTGGDGHTGATHRTKDCELTHSQEGVRQFTLTKKKNWRIARASNASTSFVFLHTTSTNGVQHARRRAAERLEATWAACAAATDDAAATAGRAHGRARQHDV